ncbi:hypothetical protein VNO78_17134 [Psophocarpus tetragonolobus]|uniref:Uncharacterized protein n=1 Tax=Psophocarpus tetragonolobus TaxID=3891 RepID=A0AAN9SGI0_PSOTE
MTVLFCYLTANKIVVILRYASFIAIVSLAKLLKGTGLLCVGLGIEVFGKEAGGGFAILDHAIQTYWEMVRARMASIQERTEFQML